MATTYAVFSAIGADRLGIVDDLSGIVGERGGNIEESKMAVLGSEFAVIMLISLAAAAFDSLSSELADLEEGLGLTLSLKRTSPAAPPDAGRPYLLETYSLDGHGIVHAVSTVLRRHAINIEEMETETQRAPLTGAPLFRLRANIVLGPSQSATALRRELEELHAGQDLDLSLKPLVPARLE
jgi:glycine cleavage system transcriptional repressor